MRGIRTEIPVLILGLALLVSPPMAAGETGAAAAAPPSALVYATATVRERPCDEANAAVEEHQREIGVAVYRHELDRSSPEIGFLVPSSEEATRFTRTRLRWVTTFEPGRGVQLSAGVDIEREDGENSSMLFLPPFPRISFNGYMGGIHIGFAY